MADDLVRLFRFERSNLDLQAWDKWNSRRRYVGPKELCEANKAISGIQED